MTKEYDYEIAFQPVKLIESLKLCLVIKQISSPKLSSFKQMSFQVVHN